MCNLDSQLAEFVTNTQARLKELEARHARLGKTNISVRLERLEADAKQADYLVGRAATDYVDCMVRLTRLEESVLDRTQDGKYGVRFKLGGADVVVIHNSPFSRIIAPEQSGVPVGRDLSHIDPVKQWNTFSDPKCSECNTPLVEPGICGKCWRTQVLSGPQRVKETR